MAAALNDSAVLQHHDAVRIFNGGKAVRNNKRGSAFHQRIHAFLHQFFRSGINGGGGLIQNQHGRIRNCRPCNGKQLALTLRKVAAVAVDHGVIAVRQSGNKAVRIGKFCRGDAFLIRSIRFAVADIIHNRAGKQVGILQNNAKGAAEIRLFNLGDIDAVIADLTILNIIKAVDQIGDCGFARAGGADKRDLLTRLSIQLDIVQHHFIVRIAEIHTVQHDGALQFLVGYGAVRLMRMFPCPNAGSVVCLCNRAVLMLHGVYHFNIAVIFFRLLVKQGEHTLCACNRHDDGIHLLADLRDRHAETLVQAHKRNNRADRCAGDTGCAAHAKAKRRADCRAENVTQVADIYVNRHHHIGIFVCLIGTETKLFVDLIKICLCFFLVAEHFDHFLTVQHFLNKAVYLAKRFLLLIKISAGALGEFSGNHQHNARHKHRNARQHDIHSDHGNKGEHKRDDRIENLGYALADQLAHGINIVCIHAHDIAVGMRVKILDGQFFHIAEQIRTQFLHGILRYIYHDSGIGE